MVDKLETTLYKGFSTFVLGQSKSSSKRITNLCRLEPTSVQVHYRVTLVLNSRKAIIDNVDFGRSREKWRTERSQR